MRRIRSILLLVLNLGLASAGLRRNRNRNLLIIGQSKGYQPDSVSTAMATLYNLGRSSGQWNTFFRTDCTAITKKPLKWGAKNLNSFDAIMFFTDGDLDMDDLQKADCCRSSTMTERDSSASTAPPSRLSPGPSTAR